MDALLLMLIGGVGCLVAYHTCGRFLARKIFRLRSEAVGRILIMAYLACARFVAKPIVFSGED